MLLWTSIPLRLMRHTLLPKLLRTIYSPMAEKVDEWSAKDRKNLFGSTVDVIQM